MATEGGERPIIIIKKIIKKGGHAAHHGGAWKVAYADFVTAMMAFFMVLWLLTQADLKLRSQIAQHFRSPGMLPGGSMLSAENNPAKSRDPQLMSDDIMLLQRRAELKRQEMAKGRGAGKEEGKGEGVAQSTTVEGEQKALEAQATAVKDAIDAAARTDPALASLKDQVLIEVTQAGLAIQVVDRGKNMLFDLSSADLKPELVSLLRKVAPILGRLPNPVLLGGHTDARQFPLGSLTSNWDLSFERANNARLILETYGIRAGQIERVIAYADSEPLLPDQPLADQNRRLSILAERQAQEKDGSSCEFYMSPPESPPDKLVAASASSSTGPASPVSSTTH